jgi:hypothetical protein
MTLLSYLREKPEAIPSWLDQFANGERFRPEQFFASRVVYYPGSGTDGQPVKLFGSTHCAHTFVYADYGVTQARLQAELCHPTHRFLGYHTLARVELAEGDLAPGGWVPHIDSEDGKADRHRLAGFLNVLERDRELGDAHGARRLAILFLVADGIAAYDTLFCQSPNIPTPFVVVVQDHSFGGNYTRFGRGGLLERVARCCDVLPSSLLVAEHTRPWDGYSRVPDVDGDRGGMHNTLRFLYERFGG